jgi:DNA-binding transcriptional MerR regulator
MIRINAQDYPTVFEAAKEFEVSAKTVREWIERGVIAKPPMIEQGLRTIMYFPPEYMKKAKDQLRRYRERKAA